MVTRLAAISAAALVLRLALAQGFVGISAPPRASAQFDQVDYEELAWSLASTGRYTWAGGQPTALRAPGTAMALAPVYALFGRSWAAGRIWLCMLGAATVFAVGLLGWTVFRSETAGSAAAVILALYPGHAYHSMHFVSEVPYGLWLTLSLLLALSPAGPAVRRRWLDLGSGAALALATLTRPQGLFIVPFVAVAVAFARPRTPAAIRAATLGLAFALVLAPWVIRNTVVMGRMTLSTIGGITFWGAHNPAVLEPDAVGLYVRTPELVDAAHPLDGPELEAEAAAWRYGREFVVTHVGELPRLFVWKLLRLVAPFESTPNRLVYWSFGLAWIALMPLVAIGTRRLLQLDRQAATVLLLPLVALVVTALVFYGSVRFRDTTITVLACLAGGGLTAVLPSRWSLAADPGPAVR